MQRIVLRREKLKAGNIRGNPFRDFVETIVAGDSAHIAAAAYQTRIADELLARGADVRARNRRGAEPLH
jgi:hypothetical protein